MSAAATAPDLMSASVYRGSGRVVYEQIGVPAIGPGEILVKVAACGICHTDLAVRDAQLPVCLLYTF